MAERSDLREFRLIKRKRELRKLVPNGFPHVLYVDYKMEGERLFELACERDLEGIVAKHLARVQEYSYSQVIGRDELFERGTVATKLPTTIPRGNFVRSFNLPSSVEVNGGKSKVA